MIVHGRRAPAVDAVAQAIGVEGGQAKGLTADLADPGDRASLISRALAGGDIDILVNNAGVFAHPRLDDAAPEEGSPPPATNVAAAVGCASRGSCSCASGWGRIVQIGTRGGESVCALLRGVQGCAAQPYGLAGQYLDRTGITVNTVSPGIVVTPGVREVHRLEACRRGWGEDWPIEAGVLAEVLDNPTGRLGRPGTSWPACSWPSSPAR